MTAKVGISELLGDIWKIFVLKSIQINYKNSCLAGIDISVLQKQAFLNNRSAARGDFLHKMTGTAGFLIGPIFFRAYLGNTVYLCQRVARCRPMSQFCEHQRLGAA